MRLFGKVVKLEQLRDEMVTAGLVVRGLSKIGDDILIANGAGELIEPQAGTQAVITAHVPAPDPAAPDYGTDDTKRDQLADAVTQLRQYLGVASPTQAQSTVALKLLIRVVLGLCRVVIR